jgi:hypothetical protein
MDQLPSPLVKVNTVRYVLIIQVTTDELEE